MPGLVPGIHVFIGSQMEAGGFFLPQDTITKKERGWPGRRREAKLRRLPAMTERASGPHEGYGSVAAADGAPVAGCRRRFAGDAVQSPHQPSCPGLSRASTSF